MPSYFFPQTQHFHLKSCPNSPSTQHAGSKSALGSGRANPPRYRGSPASVFISRFLSGAVLSLRLGREKQCRGRWRGRVKIQHTFYISRKLANSKTLVIVVRRVYSWVLCEQTPLLARIYLSPQKLHLGHCRGHSRTWAEQRKFEPHTCMSQVRTKRVAARLLVLALVAERGVLFTVCLLPRCPHFCAFSW